MPVDFAAIELIRPRMSERLSEVARAHDVEILFAVESGSRAWGFASPDSDFDCRFVYRHRRDWYVSIEEQRDVIEEGIGPDALDIAGWDVRKALRLLFRNNPVLDEWLTSPIVWLEIDGMRKAFRELFREVCDLQSFRHHHANMARSAIKRHLSDEKVKLKRYFYCLRPLMALEWMNAHAAMPPMLFDQLLAETVLPGDVRQAIDDLIGLKAVTSELGLGDHIAVLDAWIHAGHDRAFTNLPKFQPKTAMTAQKRDCIDAFYRRLIGAS